MEIGEITTLIAAFIISMGAAFCLGMYACTQISDWIDKKIKK
jgi:hypothetical protein